MEAAAEVAAVDEPKAHCYSVEDQSAKCPAAMMWSHQQLPQPLALLRREALWQAAQHRRKNRRGAVRVDLPVCRPDGRQQQNLWQGECRLLAKDWTPACLQQPGWQRHPVSLALERHVPVAGNAASRCREAAPSAPVAAWRVLACHGHLPQTATPATGTCPSLPTSPARVAAIAGEMLLHTSVEEASWVRSTMVVHRQPQAAA